MNFEKFNEELKQGILKDVEGFTEPLEKEGFDKKAIDTIKKFYLFGLMKGVKVSNLAHEYGLNFDFNIEGLG